MPSLSQADRPCRAVACSAFCITELVKPKIETYIKMPHSAKHHTNLMSRKRKHAMISRLILSKTTSQRTLQRRHGRMIAITTRIPRWLKEEGDAFAINFASNSGSADCRPGLGAMTKRIRFSRQDSHMMFTTKDRAGDTHKANIMWMLSVSVLCDFGGQQDFPKSIQILTKKLIPFEQLLRCVDDFKAFSCPGPDTTLYI